MGQSRRKFKKQEKAKTKLKESKTILPKGQNLTDTNFKVKKILIKDQVKPHDPGDVLSSRNLNLQELLSRLSHHNVYMRKESLEGINELVTNYPKEVTGSSLSAVLQNLSKLILDLMRPIRKEAIKIFANILPKVQFQQLEPFFPSMNSYLICGLTHIDCAVREDSLYYLDVLLKHTPKLCAKAINKLLPVCLDLVSHNNSSIRTLSLNLDSSSTITKWRVKVLSRIRILLTTLVEPSNDENGLQELSCEKKNYTPNHCFPHYCTKNDLIARNLQLSCLGKVESKEDFSLKGFSDTTIPLVLDMFIEIVPQKEDNVGLSTDVCTIITEEDADILKNVVEIIHLLWNIISSEENSKQKLNSLIRAHGRTVISKLIRNKFPYAVRHKKKKKSNENHDVSCRQQNLTLCKLVILFGNSSDWACVVPYLKNSFRNAKVLNKSECELLASCISCICRESEPEESKYFVNQSSVTALGDVNSLTNYCFVFLANIALDTKFRHLHREPGFIKWLYSLPTMLTKSKVSALVLERISQISIRNYESFSDSLDTHIEMILDKIPRIHIEGMDKEQAHFKIAALLYQVKDWDQELIDGVQKAIENNYWGQRVTSFIQEIMDLKIAKLKYPVAVKSVENEVMEVELDISD